MARLKFAAEAMFFPRSMSFANFVGFGPKINENLAVPIFTPAIHP